MDTQKNASMDERAEKVDFGFVGYRDYKSSEFFKRYEAARAKMPADALQEISTNREPEAPIKKCGRGNSVAITLFGLLYVALCVVGYFIHTENTVIESLLGVYDGKNIVTCVLGLLNGEFDMLGMVGAIALVASNVLAVAAVIGGIVDAATGRGVGKLMKTGCTFLFFCAVIALALVIANQSDLTIGSSGIVVFGGVTALCALTAPNKVKEKRQ